MKELQIVRPGYVLLTPKRWIADYLKLLEKAGRVCYKSEKHIKEDSASEFIRRIVKSGHESVIEHCVLTVLITCDRSTSHQLVRHRISSFSQTSQRYCDYSEGKKQFAVIIPPSIGILDPGTYEHDPFGITWSLKTKQGNRPLPHETILHARVNKWLTKRVEEYEEYNELTKQGVPSEDARSVLPNCTRTEVVTTFNLRQWRHVFRERALNKHAQWQIRGIMSDILTEFKDLLPAIFGDLDQL